MCTSVLDNKIIGIAGFGHLGSSIALALAANGFPKEHILVSCGGSASTIERIKQEGFSLAESAELFKKADVIILAARPQNVGDFAGVEVKPDSFIMSFMAGVSIDRLKTIFGPNICRVMCSGPETITDGHGIGVTFPSELLPDALLEAAGIKVLRVSCESELDSFTVGICIPPILMNIDIDAETRRAALLKMAYRFPIYREISPWIDKIVALHAKDKREASLANVSTKGGVTEAMVTCLANGGTFEDALIAGLSRNVEICRQL